MLYDEAFLFLHLHFQMIIKCVTSSDEPEPSWHEPYLELKNFQLGSARDLFHFSSELKIDWKTSWNFNSPFLHDMKKMGENKLD